MNEEKYKRIFAYLEAHDTLKQAVIFINNWVTLITYLAYPLMIIRLLADTDKRIIKFILIPVIAFLLVSIVRKLVNAPRPYEIYDITPIISKDTKGNSCPSRHVFSIIIIAMGFLYIQIPLGILFIILGMLLAVCRVAVGVHFPKDVIIGAVAAIVCGLGFFIF